MNRLDLLRALRDATCDDLWLSQYALFKATEPLDWVELGQLLDEVLDAADGPATVPSQLRELLLERWGITFA